MSGTRLTHSISRDERGRCSVVFYVIRSRLVCWKPRSPSSGTSPMLSAVLARIREWFDAPRFCPDDGRPIEVEDLGGFDGKTGDRRHRWVWHCPGVSVDWEGGAITWSQRGTYSVHAHGTGRPGWYVEDPS